MALFNWPAVEICSSPLSAIVPIFVPTLTIERRCKFHKIQMPGENHVEATLFVLVSLYCGSVKNQPNLNRQEEEIQTFHCLLQVREVFAPPTFDSLMFFMAPVRHQRFGAQDKLVGCQEIRLHILNKDKL